jgi:hypothetical protein
LITSDGSKQSFLQQILGEPGFADTRQGVSVKVVTMTIQPLAWIDLGLCVASGFHRPGLDYLKD